MNSKKNRQTNYINNNNNTTIILTKFKNNER